MTTLKIAEKNYSYFLCERQLARAPTGWVSQGAIYDHEDGKFWVDPLMNVGTDCQPIERERALKIAGVESFPDGPDPTDERLKDL